MAHFPKHLDKTEAEIINRLLTAVLQAGHHVMVVDGEDGEPMTERTRDRATIQREVGATGITVLGIYRGTERLPERADRVGDYVLIHGNGEDVISDFTWPRHAPVNEQLLQTYADRAAKAGLQGAD